MPELPAQRRKSEAYYTPRVLAALRQDERFGSCAIELKVARGNSLPASRLEPHQREALLRCGMAFTYKIPDVGFDKKPFDALLFKNSNAYVVIVFPSRVVEVLAVPVGAFPLHGSVTREYARKFGLAVAVSRAGQTR